ncbi:MAG TPA: invasin domain 3-containing protein [Gemmatimonadales bacterium]|nr:invasin domain 3-containing protein [Gemmatimonadales bacterium]
MSDARIGHRHGPRPDRRGLVALLLVTALATCTTDHTPTGPGRGGRGFLAVRPLVSSPVSLAAFNLTIDGLHIVATRVPSGIALDTTIFFSPDSTTLHLALPLALNSNPETFTLLVELLAGSKVLFSGTQSVSVTIGPPDTSAAATVPLAFVGPGAKLNHIHITPLDSVVNLGGTQLFHATADSSGQPVDSFYVTWTTSDTTLAKINGQGLLKAPGARGAVLVKAITPNNVRDSTRVTFIPTPVALGIVSGNGQTATVTTRLPLPLRVQVKASDSLGVKGVPVRFRAIAGDSLSDSVVASDTGGYAEDTAFFGTVAGTRRFVVTVGALKPDTFSVTATAGAVSAAQSVVTVSSATIGSGGVATLTLQAKDAFGNNLTTGGATVLFSASGGTSTGTIGSVVDHANGTYTATFTGLVSGTATTISATVNGTAVTTTLPTIAVTAGAISPLTSVVSTSSGTVASGASATLTLVAKDSGGNAITTGGATVVFTRAGGTSTGTIGATTDHANGTYTATFTGDTAGTATTIHATIGGVAVTSTTTITVVPGNTVAAKSVITVSKDTVAAGTTSTLTLQAKDTAGNNITTGGLVVVFSRAGGTSTGSISATTDHANGTYTAVFTGDTAGTATTIHATIGAQQVTSTLPTITVIPGAISPVKSVVTSSDSTTTTGGVLTLTLTAKDAAGNALTQGGATVVFTQGGGTSTGAISATTDHANGTYTATFTGANGGTATTIGATIGGVAVTSTPLPTIRVINTVHAADILADETWAAGSHTVSAYIRVRNGAKLTIALGATVKFDAGAGLQIGDTALNQSGQLLMDGTQPGAAPGITLTANTGSPVPGFWKGIEVQRNVALTTWRRTLIEWAGGVRTPFGALPSEACILFVNRSGAEVDLDSLRIRQCVHAGVHHFGGTSHIHRSEVDSVTGSGIHADLDATLQLDSNTVRGSGQEGLLLGSTATHLSPSRFNRFLGNATFGIQMQAVQLPGLLKQDSIAGNTTDFLAVAGGQPDPTVSAFTIFAQPQRAGSNGYLINGLLDIGRSGGQTVTLDSNLVLRFGSQSGMLIGDSAGTRSGSIVSLGTNRSNAPRLTSASLSPAPGDWYGLDIGRLSANTRLDNVRVEFAGDSIPGRSKHRFGLLVHSPAAQTMTLDSVVVVQSGRVGSDTNSAGIGVLGSGSGVDVRRSVAQGNHGYGIVVAGVPNVKLVGDTANGNTVGFALFTDNFGTSAVAPGDSVAGNVATGNTLYPLQLDMPRLPVLFASNAFTGNGRDTVLLHAGPVTFTGTLPRFAGVPWRVSAGTIDIDSGGALTIAAGNTLAFDSLAGIIVGSNNATGALAAVGTSPAPILMTTSYTLPALSRHGWAGVEWRNPASSGNSFTFVTVEHAGYVFQPQCDCSQIQVGALRSADTAQAINVNLTFDHLTVRGSFAFAIDFRRSGTGTLTITNSQFYDNGSFDPMIRAFINQPNQLTISGSDLYHYRGWIMQASDTVNAVGNWWGDVAGLDSGYSGADSLGRAFLAFNPVKFTPFQLTPFFPVGSAVGLVQTADSALTPQLSTSDSIRVRAIDAVGRGVSGGTVNWSASPLTSILPASGPVDVGGRAGANWSFTNSAGTKIATASGIGTPTHYVADVQPGVTVSTNWTLLSSPLSQGTVTAPKAITFTSTNRRGVLITKSVDQFNNPTQPFYCTAPAGFGCVGFSYATIDSIHTSGGTNGDSVFFHSIVNNPAQFVLRGQYNTASGLAFDSVMITMNPAVAGVKIDRDPNIGGVQATPDTVLISSLCPTGPGNFYCQGTYNAFLVDSGLAPLPSGNAVFGWNLVSGTAVTFDSQTAVFPHDIGFVTARANGVARIAVKDVSGNGFGTDTLPILVQQLPNAVLVSPDTVSVPVGGTTVFHAAVIDQAGDTMTTPIHWRRDLSFNYHLTVIDTSIANQATVRLDSTPFGTEYVDAFAVRAPGDTIFGFGGIVNPVLLHLTVGQQPWALAVNSQTHAAYAGHQGGQIYQMNGTTDVVVDSVSAGQFVSAVAVNSITNRVFVGMDAGVRVLDGATLGTVTTIATGTTQQGVTNRQGLAVDSINNRIYVTVDIGSAAPNPILRRIDGATNTFSTSNDVALPGLGISAAFDPVNGLVYVAIPDSNFVVAVDPVAKTFSRIPVGSFPIAVAVNPLTNRVYVVNQSSNDVSVINGSTQTVITTVTTFYNEASLAVDAVNNKVYVGVSGLSYLLVIDGQTDVFQSVLSLSPFSNTEFGVAFDAGNKKVWSADYSTSTVTRLKF